MSPTNRYAVEIWDGRYRIIDTEDDGRVIAWTHLRWTALETAAAMNAGEGGMTAHPDGPLTPAAEHVTEPDTFVETGGWWPAICTCGVNLGRFPEAETAADALMDHVFDEAYREGAIRGFPSGAKA